MRLFYQPRVELALHALRNALVGCAMLVRFMTARSKGRTGRNWTILLDAADADFKKAKQWLDKRHKRGGRHA